MRIDDTSVLKVCLSQPQDSLWWPNLTEALVNSRRNRGVSDNFPSCAGYTTSRYLTNDAESDPFMLWVAPAASFHGPNLRLECPSYNAAKHELLSSRELASFNEITRPVVVNAVSKASALIGSIPSLAESVERLAQSIHVIRQDDPSYDVSFSEPHIPFSIFVSIPGDSWKAAVRVAEAIIHEAMHLQLSLVEHLVPLERECAKPQYSPWKSTVRPVSGVIHALYVFAVIDNWLELLSPRWSIGDYVRKRRQQIACEVDEIDFSACKAGATDEGRVLIETIATRFDHR